MLITLAIIGVVAALTIPTLISNYQKNQYVTQLKKNYNVIQNGFRQYMATQGVTKLTDTKLWSVKKPEGPGNITARIQSQRPFQTELATIFKITKQYAIVKTAEDKKQFSEYTWHFLDNSDFDNVLSIGYPSFFLTDGTFVLYSCGSETLSDYPDKIKELNGKLKSWVCELYIDVNGFKKPNTYGRDVFVFLLDNQATLFPWGGRDGAIYEYGDETKNWNSTDEEVNCRVDISSIGYSCAARIIEEGWKMTY